MAKSTPAFQFYPSDFLGGVMTLSDEACGIYIKILAALWINGNKLPFCFEKLARCAMTSTNAVESCWPEIESKFVIADGQISNDRLDETKRIQEIRQESGSKGGKKTQSHKNSNGFVYTAKRGDGMIKIGCSSNPKQRIKGIRRQFPKAILVKSWAVDDMLAAETELHDQFAENRVEGEWFKLKSGYSSKITKTLKASGYLSAIDAHQKAPHSQLACMKSEERRTKNEDRSLKVEAWEVPDCLDTPEVRQGLAEFAAMRRSIGKPIKSLKNSSRILKRFDSPEHLLYAIEFCIGNEYQGLKPEYRPERQKNGQLGPGERTLLNGIEALEGFEGFAE